MKRDRIGLASYVAVILNLPVVIGLFTLIFLGGVALVFLIAVLVDIFASIVLALSTGRSAQIGKGMLIAWVWLPVALAILVPGVVIANAIGPL